MITTIGFTGTRAGLTQPQRTAVCKILEAYRAHHKATWFVHGDCIGADLEAHAYATTLGYKTHGMPANLPKQRANCAVTVCDEPQAPLVRNKKIVGKADLMIACPETAEEVVRSGTWSTIRFARLTKTPLLLCNPDGLVRVECLSYWS